VGSVRPAPFALPLLAVFSSQTEMLERVIKEWVCDYGPELDRYGPYPFAYTDYYTEEMGAGLEKVIVIGSRPICQDQLPVLKQASNRCEQQWNDDDGRRLVNLDPGFIDTDRLQLATTKHAAHRIYLRDGIYAETTLIFRHGNYQSLSWTYPDFFAPEFLRFLGECRPRMQELLRQGT